MIRDLCSPEQATCHGSDHQDCPPQINTAMKPEPGEEDKNKRIKEKSCQRRRTHLHTGKRQRSHPLQAGGHKRNSVAEQPTEDRCRHSPPRQQEKQQCSHQQDIGTGDDKHIGEQEEQWHPAEDAGCKRRSGHLGNNSDIKEVRQPAPPVWAMLFCPLAVVGQEIDDKENCKEGHLEAYIH